MKIVIVITFFYNNNLKIAHLRNISKTVDYIPKKLMFAKCNCLKNGLVHILYLVVYVIFGKNYNISKLRY